MIIVTYKLGGFYNWDGGENKVHAFNSIEEVTKELKGIYSPYLYSVNDLEVYLQTSSKVGGEFDIELTDTVFNILIKENSNDK